MLGVCTLLIGLTVTVPGEPEQPKIQAESFQRWFDMAVNGQVELSPTSRQRVVAFRYVFIGGYQGEMMKGYFNQNTRELRANGISNKAIHQIQPSSKRTVEENRTDVAEILQELASRGPQRLVIIAHSRGACDAMAFALHEPEFVQERVEAIFMIQGAFGGTGLADFVLDQGEPIDGRMGPGHRFMSNTIYKLERTFGHANRVHGLSDMTCQAAQTYWRSSMTLCASAIPMVSPRIYYVEASAANSRLPMVQRTLRKYLSIHYGPNDGIVAREDQSIEGIGQIVASVEAGHADLTRQGFASHAGRRSRQALVQSILIAISR